MIKAQKKINSLRMKRKGVFVSVQNQIQQIKQAGNRQEEKSYP